jgi:dinuclear metal center YbgI/SA1388 family protein
MADNLDKIIETLKETFNYNIYQDSSQNGLQVEATKNITKIGAAVDYAASIVEKAKKAKVDLLITHHGLLWGGSDPIVGEFGQKIKTLLKYNINLVGIHLPLDAHPTLGNNSIILRDILGFDSIEPAVIFGTQTIGFKSFNPNKIPLTLIFDKMKKIKGGLKSPLLINFGPKIPKRICVVSGAAADGLYQFKQEGFDTFITGEPRQFAYHFCKEHKLNAIFAGHYGTETFGVCAVAKTLAKSFNVPWTFIDEPTGV